MKTFIASLLALLAVTPQRTLDEFFNDFTARWVRNNPNLAVSSRYTGDERDRLEQQLAPETMESCAVSSRISPRLPRRRHQLVGRRGRVDAWIPVERLFQRERAAIEVPEDAVVHPRFELCGQHLPEDLSDLKAWKW